MDPVMKDTTPPGWFAAHQNVRTDAYVILGSLLTQQPAENLMNTLRNLQWDEAISESMDIALEALRQAAHDYTLAAVVDEFNRLFVGLGRGELVPYASWYREKRIQSSPLAALRSDLMRLGIVRRAGSIETEDHAGALCEVMALISQGQGRIPRAVQAKFFEDHIALWLSDFFRDLRCAASARFYRQVGLFGSSFLESDEKYLTYGERRN